MQASVVIPTYNRPDQLSRCLTALLNQSYSGAWEVLVVDDGGEAPLKSIEDIFGPDLQCSFFRQENSGPAKARNYGVAMAKGEFIAFLDDDCEPKDDWLEHLMNVAKEGVMVGGKTQNKLVRNLYSVASQSLVYYLYEYFRDTPWYFFTSNNFLVDRKSFLAVGGFDEHFRTSAGEDRAFCAKWLARGFQMKYEQKAIIDHAHGLGFFSFWRLHRKYGEAIDQYREVLTEHDVPPMPFRAQFYWGLLKWPFVFAQLSFSKRIATSILFSISQLATFTGFIKTRFGSESK